MRITIETFEKHFGVSTSSGAVNLLFTTQSLEEVIGQVRLALEGERLKRPLRDQIYQREGPPGVDKLRSDQPAQQVEGEAILTAFGPIAQSHASLHKMMLTANPLYKKLVENSAATELPVTQPQEMGMYEPEPDVSAITALIVKRYR